VQDVGVGDLRRDVGPGDIAGQGSQRTFLRLVLVEIPVQHGQQVRILRPQAGQQSMARPHHLGEQIVLGPEVGIEAAAGQAGGQHDVVDVGAGVAAQPEQAGCVGEDFGPDPGDVGGGWRHFMSVNISYDN
jgi:hypothetical protein